MMTADTEPMGHISYDLVYGFIWHKPPRPCRGTTAPTIPPPAADIEAWAAENDKFRDRLPRLGNPYKPAIITGLDDALR